MAVTWEIRQTVLLLTSNDNGGLGTAAAVTEALADPRFRPGSALLFDMRIAADNSTSDEIRSRARFLATLPPLGFSRRCALVVGPRPHQYGLGRMEAAHLECYGMEPQLFADVDEALLWLTSAVKSEPSAA